jgi:hypothetical protein
MLLRSAAILFALAISSCSPDPEKTAADSAAANSSVKDTVAAIAKQDSAGASVIMNAVSANEYSIEIPSHLSRATTLNQEASLQYQDAVNGLFVIVMDDLKPGIKATMKQLGIYDEKAGIAHNYREANMRMLVSNIRLVSTPTIRRDTLNKLDAEVVEFTGIANPTDGEIFYKIAFVEGNLSMHTIMCWTPVKNRQVYNAEMEQIINSFRVQ